MMGLPLQARALSHQNRSPLLFSTGFCLNSHQTRNARMQSDAVQAKNTPTWDVLAKLQVSSTTAPSSLVSASFLCKRALSAECGYGKGGGCSDCNSEIPPLAILLPAASATVLRSFCFCLGRPCHFSRLLHRTPQSPPSLGFTRL